MTKCLHDAEVCTDIHIQATEFVFMDAEVTGKKRVSRLCVAVGGYVAADHTSGTDRVAFTDQIFSSHPI